MKSFSETAGAQTDTTRGMYLSGTTATGYVFVAVKAYKDDSGKFGERWLVECYPDGGDAVRDARLISFTMTSAAAKQLADIPTTDYPFTFRVVRDGQTFKLADPSERDNNGHF